MIRQDQKLYQYGKYYFYRYKYVWGYMVDNFKNSFSMQYIIYMLPIQSV